MISILEETYPVDVTCAFTVQEEIGLRGATVAGRQVDADAAIVLEGTSANDIGDIPEHLRVCRLGGGVAVSFMDRASIASFDLYEKLLSVAEKAGIAHQVKTFVSGGNDAGALRTTRGGMKTCVLSVPCRYIHSSSSVAKFSDIEAQYALVHAFLMNGGIDR